MIHKNRRRISPTIRNSIQYACKEPFRLLADKLRIFIMGVTSSRLEFGFRNCKDIFTILVSEGNVDVADVKMRVSISKFYKNLCSPATPRELTKKGVNPRSVKVEERRELTPPHGLAMKLGIIPCFMPTLFAMYLNKMALSAIFSAVV